MSHELFMDLSEEQQERVSGGGELEELEEYDFTKYLNQQFDLQKQIESGPGGSSITKRVMVDFTDTYAFETLDLDFEADVPTVPRV